MKKCFLSMSAVAAVVLLAQCGLLPTPFGRTVEGKITTASDENAGFYFNTYLAEFVQGQTYTADLVSPDGAPVHFEIDDFDVDFEAWEHSVRIFEASSGGEVYFDIYLSEDYLGSGKRYVFTIREGINGPAVVYQSDANRVAQDLIDMVFHAAPHLSPWSWTNHAVTGYVAGDAAVSGVYGETSGYLTGSSTYDDVTVVFDGFQDYDDFPKIAGTANLTGTIHVDSSYSFGNDYSGAWYMSGTVALSGIWNDSISYSFTFSQDSSAHWLGSIATGSDDFNVGSGD